MCTIVNIDKSVTTVVKWCEHLRRFLGAKFRILLGVTLCVHFLPRCGICLWFLWRHFNFYRAQFYATLRPQSLFTSKYL